MKQHLYHFFNFLNWDMKIWTVCHSCGPETIYPWIRILIPGLSMVPLEHLITNIRGITFCPTPISQSVFLYISALASYRFSHTIAHWGFSIIWPMMSCIMTFFTWNNVINVFPVFTDLPDHILNNHIYWTSWKQVFTLGLFTDNLHPTKICCPIDQLHNLMRTQKQQAITFTSSG